MSEQLIDDSPMPFGKYKGKPMQDVPADYFHWLWTNKKPSDNDKPVFKYIKANLNALKMEYTDGIWE